mgnify:CR=1 FL=1
MTDFMGNTTLLPPKTELVQGMMMSLMDAIAHAVYRKIAALQHIALPLVGKRLFGKFPRTFGGLVRINFGLF